MNVQDKADEYFREYQKMCISNPQMMMNDLKRWESVKNIYDLPIEKQAEYADYVTKKLVQLPSKELQPWIVEILKDCVSSSLKGGGSCAVGNTALLIINMEEGPEKEKAKENFATALK